MAREGAGEAIDGVPTATRRRSRVVPRVGAATWMAVTLCTGLALSACSSGGSSRGADIRAAESATLAPEDLPGSWKVDATVHGAEVPRLGLCRGPLVDISKVSAASSRTLSSSEHALRSDVFEMADADDALSMIETAFADCGRFSQRTGAGELTAEARPATARSGIVAGRLTTDLSGRLVENLVLATARQGVLHVVTLFDDRARGVGNIALVVQELLAGAER